MASYHTVLYSGGPLGPTQIDQHITDIQQSGFTTVVLWSFHIASNGDITFNDPPTLVSGGKYIGDTSWPGKVAQLKQNGSSVSKIFLSVGAGGVSDFTHIQKLIQQYGTGPTSILCQNFMALRQAFTINGQCVVDGIDFDNEDNYDQDSMVQFAVMLFNMGFEVTFCPYTFTQFWVDSLKALWKQGYRVSWWNLQCYSGGAGNNPQDWINAVAPVVGKSAAPAFIVPGLWCYQTSSPSDAKCPEKICSPFSNWNAPPNNMGLQGGFIWLYDDILKFEDSNPCQWTATTAGYANAIVKGLGQNCG
jgi:hypothetical protein